MVDWVRQGPPAAGAPNKAAYDAYLVQARAQETEDDKLPFSAAFFDAMTLRREWLQKTPIYEAICVQFAARVGITEVETMFDQQLKKTFLSNLDDRIKAIKRKIESDFENLKRGQTLDRELTDRTQQELEPFTQVARRALPASWYYLGSVATVQVLRTLLSTITSSDAVIQDLSTLMLERNGYRPVAALLDNGNGVFDARLFAKLQLNARAQTARPASAAVWNQQLLEITNLAFASLATKEGVTGFFSPLWSAMRTLLTANPTLQSNKLFAPFTGMYVDSTDANRPLKRWQEMLTSTNYSTVTHVPRLRDHGPRCWLSRACAAQV